MDNCSTENTRALLVGRDWIRVQEILKRQEDMRYRLPRKNKAILSGIIKCSNCGSNLRAKMSPNDNGKRFYYVCELKERSNRHKCNIKNLNGNDVDKIVLNEIKKLVSPNSQMYDALKKIATTVDDEEERKKSEIRRLRSLIRKNERDIDAYVENIKMIKDVEVMNKVVKKMEQLGVSNIELNKQIEELSVDKKKICDKRTANLLLNMFDEYSNKFDELDILQQRDLIKLLVKDVITDGENITINLIDTNEKKSSELFPIGENSK